MIDYRWCVFMARGKPTSCILVLPGRAQQGIDLARAWIKTEMEDTLIIAVTPYTKQWYPQPFSSFQQQEAVNGLPVARNAIEEVLQKIENEFLIPRNKIAIVGFSAGGVMAIDVACHSNRELAGVVSHAGAILEPHDLPPCLFPEMPIILTHCEDDDVFDWEERYLPMVRALDEENYNLYAVENSYGGHGISFEDILDSARIISKRLGYSDEWLESHRDLYNLA